MVRYFIVDSKISGYDVFNDCLLTIGIVELNHKDNKFTPMYNRQFYVEMIPMMSINPFYTEVNGIDLAMLKKYGINNVNFIRELNKYLDLKEDDKAIYISYNQDINRLFINRIYQNNNINDSIFEQQTINISSLALMKYKLPADFEEKELNNILQLDKNDSNNSLGMAVLRAKQFCEITN